jgi:hypothetical protein
MATATGTSDSVSDRLARLATWKPGGGVAVSAEERMPVFLLVGGAVCMVLGLIAVILGWYGAAHTPFGFEQTPYLISGGLFGIALVLVGGFLFFGSWLARVAVTSQQTVQEMAALSARIDRLGEAGVGTAANGATGTRSSGGSGRLVATQSGTMLHRADCPIVVSRDNVRDVPASEQDQLKPCQICNPLD